MLKGLHQNSVLECWNTLRRYKFQVCRPSKSYSDTVIVLDFEQEVRTPTLTFNNGSIIVIDETIPENEIWTVRDIPF